MAATSVNCWYLLSSPAGESAYNMALDEALLWEASRLGHCVLRFYSWTEPAASFGYFQKFAEVATWTNLRPLVRRPTGGGLVPHLADWTYSFVVPPSEPWYSLRAPASYRRLHEWIQGAFARMDIPTQLNPERRLEQPGQCFVGAEKDDLLWHGRKIAGAAQRRNRAGLLVQGSVQPAPPGVLREQWEKAMTDYAQTEWRIQWARLDLDPALEARTLTLASEKFSQIAYNQQR